MGLPLLKPQAPVPPLTLTPETLSAEISANESSMQTGVYSLDTALVNKLIIVSREETLSADTSTEICADESSMQTGGYSLDTTLVNKLIIVFAVAVFFVLFHMQVMGNEDAQ